MRRPAFWLGIFCLWLSQYVQAISAEDADRYLRRNVPSLAGNPKELRAIYYFGESRGISLIGLEQVDANTFLPKRWLIIFRGDQLSGWYSPLDEFPRALEQGILKFPPGTGIAPMSLEQIGQPLQIKQRSLEFTPWP